MKLFKNKIFLSVLAGILFLFSLQFYFISESYKRDTNSYVTLLEWHATLTTGGAKKVLKLNIKEKLSNGDIVNTLSNSLVVIEWGDKSITRLGENSRIIIKENFVSEDLSKINISFELLKGKTWSNVLSIFWSDSQFKQEVRWVSAAVRGTVFEASYDQEYIMVHKHAVQLTNASWETTEVYQGQAIILKTFTLDDVKNLIDETFQNFNKKLDQEYLQKLREEFILSFQSSNPLNLVRKMSDEYKILNMLMEENPKQEFENFLSWLSDEKKQKVVWYLETLNQNLNFENGENSFLYHLKLNTRENLIENTQSDTQKETLMRYSVYDLMELSKNSELFQKTAQFVYENKSYVNLKELQWYGVNIIGDTLFLNGEMIHLQNLQTTVSQIDTIAQEKIYGLLDNVLYFIRKWFQ